MTRLNVLLLIALLASSIVLVRVSYDARRLFAQIDKAQRDARQLDVDYDRLDAERQSQATPSRVEAVARSQLGMRTATPAVTQYVTYTPRAASAAAGAGEPAPAARGGAAGSGAR